MIYPASVSPVYRHRFVISLFLVALFSLNLNAEPVDAEHQRIQIALTQEPPNLNTMRTTDLVSFFLLGHVGEGLLRYDRRGRLVPGVAERWEVEPSGITFYLREDAKWHDGSPVTAHDFAFAWQRVNDPKEAAPFAAIMYPIKNAEAVQSGTLPVSALGVRALADRVLRMDLERPCGYCLGMMTHATFYPVQQKFYLAQGEKFGAEPEHLLANGPFVMTDWTHEASITLKKNPFYWDQNKIQLNEIEIAYITADNRTRLNLFRDGQIAYVRLDAETVKEAVDARMRLRTFTSGGLAYVQFNLRPDRATSNKALRQAIQAAFDPDQYVNQVIAIPGYKPTRTFFPSWLNGVEGKFTKEYPPVDVPTDRAKARQLMQVARSELGEIDPITILTVASPTGAKVAEYFQGLLRQVLSVEALVDQQTFKQYLSKNRQGDFDLVMSSWYPDYDDIVTYADLLGSYNPNNRGRYENPVYDADLKILMESLDPKTRFDAAGRLQQIIIEDVPVMPTAETGSAYMVHPRLKGVVRRVLGQDPDFTYARVIN